MVNKTSAKTTVSRDVCSSVRFVMVRAAGLVIYRVLESQIQYLLLKASYGDLHWTPPKGHVDPGESDWVTALRETREESGLDESSLEIFKDISATLEYTVKNKNKSVVYWLAKLKDPHTKVTLSEEHTDLRWSNLSDTQQLSGYKDFNEMLNKFHNFVLKTQ